MEVHHPHHPTQKKKWSEYIIEFVMLFTAVTLGFFAENIREHLAENEKKNELMKIVSLDLQRDLNQLEFHKQDYVVKFKTCDSLINTLGSDPKTINTATYYRLLCNHLGYWNFNPNDKSRNDADSKGYFRDDKNAELALCISKYNFFLLDYKAVEEESAIYRMRLKNEMEYMTEESFYDKVAVVEFEKIPETIGIKAPDKAATKRVKYITLNWKNIYRGYLADIDSLNFYANKAVILIKKEFK
ncbi:MAG: hypothetical protein WCL56_09040 [Sediminibacterium sp.]|jgi:hypothetical protein